VQISIPSEQLTKHFVLTAFALGRQRPYNEQPADQFIDVQVVCVVGGIELS